MEAKELERIINSAELRNPKTFNSSRERYVAEISFKAGQEEAYLRDHMKENSEESGGVDGAESPLPTN